MPRGARGRGRDRERGSRRGSRHSHTPGAGWGWGRDTRSLGPVRPHLQNVLPACPPLRHEAPESPLQVGLHKHEVLGASNLGDAGQTRPPSTAQPCKLQRVSRCQWLEKELNRREFRICGNDTWGARVARSVGRPTSAQVTVPRSVSSSPTSGSVPTARSPEPASDSASPSLSAPPLLALCLSQK